jgi:hypothetical protein
MPADIEMAGPDVVADANAPVLTVPEDVEIVGALRRLRGARRHRR